MQLDPTRDESIPTCCFINVGFARNEYFPGQ